MKFYVGFLIGIIALAMYGYCNPPHKSKSMYLETRYIGYVNRGEVERIEEIPHSIQKIEDTLFLKSLLTLDSTRFTIDTTIVNQKYPVFYTNGMYIVWGNDWVAFYQDNNLDNCRIFSNQKGLKDYRDENE